MDFLNLSTVLADAASVAATPQQPGAGDLLRMVVPLAIVMVGFMYISSRAQKKKAKDHEDKIKSLKSGDKIITSSGIIATVVTVKENAVSIRSADAKLEITKGAIAEIVERSGESSAS